MVCMSQSAFDESVVENQECFELTHDEAVQETVEQYRKIGAISLSHLSVTHPESTEGQRERQERATFEQALVKLDACVSGETGCVSLLDNRKHDYDDSFVLDSLDLIRRHCDCHAPSTLAYLTLMQQHEAFYTLLSFLGVEDEALLQATLGTLIVLLTPRQPQQSQIHDLQQSFRDCMAPVIDRWGVLWNESFTKGDKEASQQRQQSLLLQLAYVSCRFHEPNKVALVQTLKKKKSGGLESLLRALSCPYDAVATPLHAARLLAVMCKFDDFRIHKPNNNNNNNNNSPIQAPTVSSAHSHVLELAQAGAVPALMGALERSSSQEENNATTTHVLLALRALAIQDDLVQSLVAAGVLTHVQHALDMTSSPTRKNPKSAVERHAAALGLIRNLSANDDIKTTLCLGSSEVRSVLPAVQHCMTRHLASAVVQEHACATLAAMALRKPKNAACMVFQHALHTSILTAMKQHAHHVLVQRQGCLALRNLASRSRDANPTSTTDRTANPLTGTSMREALLEGGAEVVLRTIAGQHQGSVEEAYAALRDLQCEVSLIKYNAAGKAQTKPVLFGESTNTKFRPVFETSRQLDPRQGI